MLKAVVKDILPDIDWIGSQNMSYVSFRPLYCRIVWIGRLIDGSKNGKISVCNSFCGGRARAGAHLQTNLAEIEQTAGGRSRPYRAKQLTGLVFNHPDRWTTFAHGPRYLESVLSAQQWEAN
jgi:hypothetical protein